MARSAECWSTGWATAGRPSCPTWSGRPDAGRTGLYWTVGLPIWGLFGLVFAAGLLDTPGQTARTSLLPEASVRAGISLERSAGWNGAADRGSRLIGAPLAGLLILVADPLTVVLVTALACAASALLVSRWLRATEPAGSRRGAPRATGASSVRASAGCGRTRCCGR